MSYMLWSGLQSHGSWGAMGQAWVEFEGPAFSVWQRPIATCNGARSLL